MNKAAEEGEREGGEEPEEEEEDQGVFSISGGNNIDDEGGRHNVPRAFTAGTQEAALDRRASAASSSSALSYLSNGVFSFGDDFSLDGKSAVATTDADNVEDNHLKPTSAVQVMTKSPGPNSARRVAPDTGTGERRKPSTSSSVAPGGTPYPQAVRISRGEEFAQGLLGCCNSPAICCCGMLCPLCQFCQVVSDLGEDPCLYFAVLLCGLPMAVAVRSTARSKYNIEGTYLGDVVAGTCCPLCTQCQVAYEVQVQGW